MKVFVGLSGGVDSAVSAALLKEQGHEVIGAYIKIWSPEFLECTWRDDRLDAKRVAVSLGIPFAEIDLSKEYLESVVRDMIESYQAGITPNPDVLCNRFIKFGAFAKWAFDNGADKIATGHYARIREHNGEFSLHRAVDTSKDQSYFLFRLGQVDLSRTLFPVGEFKKSLVREKARDFALPVANKHDSQGLCFVGDVSMSDFLGRFISLNDGNLTDAAGNIIGTHGGAALFTIGQRHGFNLLPAAPSGPYYVTKIDTISNTVTVSRDRGDSLRSSAVLGEMHWITSPQPLPLATFAVTRYHASPAEVLIDDRDGVLRMTSRAPQLFSPGQSAVLYDGDKCIGGATIAAI